MNKRWKALTVPYDIVAADTSDPQCYRLSGKTVRMLLAMIQYMEWRTRWHKSDGSELNSTEIDNVQAWAAQGAYELMTPEPCADESCEEGDCVAYYPTNPIFSYAPNNPFTTCETAPAGYLTCPLRSGLSSTIPGLLPNDIVCSIDSLLPAPPLGLIDQVLNSGFPRVHMEFSGSGEIEVHLIEVVQGGLAIVRVDDVAYVNVVNLQGIALADIRASLDFVISVITGLLDWRFINEKIIEFSVPAGDHTLDILFIPNLSLNILETGWGGGLRSVVLCGDFTSVDCPDSIIDPIGGGGGAVAGMFDICRYINIDGVETLRYTINGGCTWNDVGVCGDSPGQIPPIVIDPIDRPGETPDPEFTADTKCRVVDGTFMQLYTMAFNALLVNVVLGSPTSISANLLDWLNAWVVDEPMLYYAKFKAFLEKWIPESAALESTWDNALWGDGDLRCIVYPCVPDNGAITTEVRTCIADGLDAIAGTAPFDGVNGEKLAHALADFTRIFPISRLRYLALFHSTNPTYGGEGCDDCGEEPSVSCDIELLADFRAELTTQGFEFITGAASDWNHGDAIFGNAQMLVGTRSNVYGYVSQFQTSNPADQRAMGIQKIFAMPYDLCQLHLVTNTYTERGNSRQVAVWVRDYATGQWEAIASRKIPIYTGGHIEIFWASTTPKTIDGMTIVGYVGGNVMRFLIADLNYLIEGA